MSKMRVVQVTQPNGPFAVRSNAMKSVPQAVAGGFVRRKLPVAYPLATLFYI
jgi:hypothetical protein